MECPSCIQKGGIIRDYRKENIGVQESILFKDYIVSVSKV